MERQLENMINLVIKVSITVVVLSLAIKATADPALLFVGVQ